MRYTSIKIMIAFIAVWSILSCRKEVPTGQTITANGFVMDFVQQKRLPFVTVYLFSGHNHLLGEGGVQAFYDTIPLDSTIADVNGEFSLTYAADGNSDDYALGITKNLFHPGNKENYLPEASQPIYKFNYAYDLKDVVISARELHPANVGHTGTIKSIRHLTV
jgi:hypothetical protein